MTSTTGPSAEERRGGFTLLELVVVMVLASTVLAMAAPSLRGFLAGRQGAEAAAQVLALTHLARSRAVTQGRAYRLNMDTETNSYWLTMQQAGAFVELDCEHGRRFRFPDTVSVTLELSPAEVQASYVQFYPDGRSDQATICLTGRRGEVLEVTCPSASERFRIVSSSEPGK